MEITHIKNKLLEDIKHNSCYWYFYKLQKFYRDGRKSINELILIERREIAIT